jgi:transcription elongation factor Elf1
MDIEKQLDQLIREAKPKISYRYFYYCPKCGELPSPITAYVNILYQRLGWEDELFDDREEPKSRTTLYCKKCGSEVQYKGEEVKVVDEEAKRRLREFWFKLPQIIEHTPDFAILDDGTKVVLKTLPNCYAWYCLRCKKYEFQKPRCVHLVVVCSQIMVFDILGLKW